MAQEEEKRIVFYIPDNYTNSGGFLGGLLKLRNTIEAVAFAGGLGLFEYFAFDIPIIYKAMLIIFTAAPLAVISIIGIHGDTLTQFVVCLYLYFRNKRKMKFRRIQKEDEQSRKKSKNKNS